MDICNRFDTVEHLLCPKCQRPLVVFTGLDAECKPITLATHRIALRSFRPGKHRLR